MTANTNVRIIGIDPGLKAAGAVDLLLTYRGLVFERSPGIYAHAAFRSTGTSAFEDRALDLWAWTRAWTLDRLSEADEIPWGVSAIVIEDPRDFPAAVARRRGSRESVGAAFGVVAGAVRGVLRDWQKPETRPPVVLVPAQEWLPQQRSGRYSHPMKHEHARAYLKNLYPTLADLNDHATFAAGVAIYHANREVRP